MEMAGTRYGKSAEKRHASEPRVYLELTYANSLDGSMKLRNLLMLDAEEGLYRCLSIHFFILHTTDSKRVHMFRIPYDPISDSGDLNHLKRFGLFRNDQSGI